MKLNRKTCPKCGSKKWRYDPVRKYWKCFGKCGYEYREGEKGEGFMTVKAL